MQFQEISEIFDRHKSDREIFHDLMQEKVQEILLAATLYDSFILEQDGQLSEQIYEEYYHLNLSSAPRFTRASTPETALLKLSSKHFDMVIIMAGIDAEAPLNLAEKIKKDFPDMPIILLLNSNATIGNFTLFNNNQKDIDRVFVWNGYSSTLLAIIKYIEDKKNVAKDTHIGMVRVILLIEDSIRYYSRYLPVLYMEIMKQTQALIAEETTDEMLKILRMRARPKILLASDFDSAKKIFEEYENFIIGVISDVKYCRNGVIDPKAGIDFIKFVKSVNSDIPALLQSSDFENLVEAEKIGINCINKNSDSLALELRAFIGENLGFGRFVFRDINANPVASAGNMEEFELLLKNIPIETIVYHASRNHFSAWLMARGEIQFAKILRPSRVEDFKTHEELRSFIISIFENLKHSKLRGKIVNFDESLIGRQGVILRVAKGSFGGKGRGLTFINSLLEQTNLANEMDGIKVRIPQTAIIGIDEFNHFIETHNFQDIIYYEEDFSQIEKLFMNCELSDNIMKKLEIYLSCVKVPVAVRSSGLFEDMLTQPFAGIYSTYLLPNNNQDIKIRLKELCDAIKLVFASIFSEKSKAYFNAVNYKIEEERMAVILQEVVGRISSDVFYPDISGIAQSYNYYPVSYINPTDGMCVMALGLGSFVAEGEQAFRFSPTYPKLDIVSPEHQIESSQRYFYAIDLSLNGINLEKGEDACYRKLDISDAEKHGRLADLASVFDYQDSRLKAGLGAKGTRIINFANILKYEKYPLAKAIQSILSICEHAMGTPVEIEFAVNLEEDKSGRISLYLLQLKPLIQNRDLCTIKRENIVKDELLLFTEKGMGNGFIEDIYDVIFTDNAIFDKSATLEMRDEIAYLNNLASKNGKKYILIGPGRWGTRDRWLGIPVSFDQISNAKVIVETALPDFQIDASLGSHFFHNITSMNIGYFTIPFNSRESFIDWNFLNSLKVNKKTKYFIHASSEKPLHVVMDGQKGIALIRK